MVSKWALGLSGASSATDLCHLWMMGRFFYTRFNEGEGRIDWETIEATVSRER